ncbi:hypothetical protein P3X46_016153 [Hevea brasiliensis]|uniref:GDSL esterase/lipase n=1 Tax=Hevea brasiliensis TaxID=3981 RepID=A0ABQ9LY74_HEVBR|nr:hypothetical protein P3X46_016153 [Hevea brasiliensis]
MISAKLGIQSPPAYIDCFKKTKEVIKTKMGEAAANKHCNKAPYFVGIGSSNDYANNFLQPILADAQQPYQMGARKVVFHGLGPLGCIPSQGVKSKKGICLKRDCNTLGKSHIDKIRERCWVYKLMVLEKLITTLNRGANFLFADIYGDVLDLITNPSAYGNFNFSLPYFPPKQNLKNLVSRSQTPRCTVDNAASGLCLPNSTLCKNRKEYVF